MMEGRGDHFRKWPGRGPDFSEITLDRAGGSV